MNKPRTFRFYKENKKWYVDYPEWTGAKWELEMVEGADKMLDMIAGSRYTKEVFLQMSLSPFTLNDTEPIPTNAFKLTKIRDTPEFGGARYLLKEWYGEEINMEMWLCSVTEFVFGSLPDKIYIA